MDTTLPDAGPAQASSSAAQGVGIVPNEGTNGTVAAAPRIKVDGMLNICGALRLRSRAADSLSLMVAN